MRPRVGVVLAFRVAGVGRLHKRERRRAPVDGDRVDRHVRAVGRIGGRALEVEAEIGEALGRAVGQDDVVAGEEPVRWRVVDEVHVGVQAAVAAIAGLGINMVAECDRV